MARRFLLAASLLLALLVPLPAVGQGGVTSTISGVITDNTGAVVPGASVVATHRATGVSHEGSTNADGTFSFPGTQQRQQFR